LSKDGLAAQLAAPKTGAGSRLRPTQRRLILMRGLPRVQSWR
jgi:hypothetical protein